VSKGALRKYKIIVPLNKKLCKHIRNDSVSLCGKSYSVFSFFRFFNSTAIITDTTGKTVPKRRHINSIAAKFELNFRKTKFKMCRYRQ